MHPRDRWLTRLLSQRCTCGTPRLRLARLARSLRRTVLLGFAWTGLATTYYSGPALDSVRRWGAGLDAAAPCCPGALTVGRPPRGTR